jgi:putative membrane protein
MQITNWFRLFFKGLAIGTAAIIPGISGGTIAYMLGIYDQLIFAIVNISKAWKPSIRILLPVALGAVVAIGLLTIPLSWAFTYAPLPTVSLFAGFIIGSLPFLRKDLPKGFTPSQWVFILLPALFATLLGILSVIGKLDAGEILLTDVWVAKTVLIVVGFLGVSAFVVPGISGSMLLLDIGFYEPILNSLRRLLESINDWVALAPELINFTFLGVGALIGFFVISRLMAFLLKRYRTAVNLGVFGFILGSLVAIYFNYEIVSAYASLTWWQGLLAVTTITVGYVSSQRLYQKYAS